MLQPAAYPINDGAESRAISLVESLLDRDLVKTNFSKRDKFPNVDGFLELVRKDGNSEVPTAKLDVQIKTLETGATKFSCPASLVAYAEKVTPLPVLLICADPTNGRVFWKHVHRGMREFKDGQETFTVKFDSAVEAIDGRKIYLSQWQQIASERLAQMAGYAVLKEEVRTRLGLGRLGSEAVASLQRFLDRVNSLLDGELAGLKALEFPSIWKLGVAVETIGGNTTSYHVFTVPYGAGSPLIVDHSGQSFEQVFTALRERKSDPLGLAGYGTQQFYTSRWQMNAHGFDPEQSGTEFVVNMLKERVQQRTLRIAGRTTATEVLFQFVDDFGHTAGIEPANKLEVGALSYGLKVYFPTWYGIALGKYLALHGDFFAQSGVFPPFESIAGMPRAARPTDAEVQQNIGTPLNRPTWVRPTTFDLLSVLDAIDVLQEDQVASISRLYGQRLAKPTWVCNGFAAGEGEKRLSVLVQHAAKEYEEFLTANRLKLSRKMLKDDVATVLLFVPPTKSGNSPVIEYVTVSPRGGLPSLSLAAEWHREGETVTVEGVSHSCVGYGGFVADFLFGRTPLLKTLYALLEKDIMVSFGVPEWTSNRGLTL